MRLEKNFTNVINHEDVALEAKLVCDCENDIFNIYHTGILKKGLFGINLTKNQKQIVIKAKCPSCLKEYILYDSIIDGSRPKGVRLDDYKLFNYKDENSFKITMKYNFYEENFNTDKFEMIFIEGNNVNLKKTILIYEE